MNPGEFPHSEISGSMLICSSPKLFAAYHVFHRLPVPRHSPCALVRLTFQTFFKNIWYPLDSLLPTKIMLPFLLKLQYFLKRTYYNLCFAVIIQFSRYVLVMSLKAQFPVTPILHHMVGQNGLEPSTSRLSVVCSSQLSYWPMWWRLRESNP